MRSNWRRTLGNVRSFVGNSMGGLRGGSNLASWVVAGTLAYFLWVKPSQELKREQQERAALAASDPNRYIERRKPIPDPQETGLIYGKKNLDRNVLILEIVMVLIYLLKGRIVPFIRILVVLVQIGGTGLLVTGLEIRGFKLCQAPLRRTLLWIWQN
ncbi:hypothetical protein FNV43_RR12120 [Rhamnella rubrinervis]|uniref:Uncharacterized protein n=1 Tax=Rhamnella rubrinervis TaxID=2594499 RepID=A0A8K0H7P2_9ROSA|nr:hypothetical protein FNV43_RR12120 [Rhamnella rubrinervis]